MRRLGQVVEHVANCHGGNAGGNGHLGEARQPEDVVRSAQGGQRQVGPITEDAAMTGELAIERIVRLVGQQDGDQPFGMSCQVLPADVEAALFSAALAERDQAAQGSIGGAIGRVDQQRQAVAQIEPAADGQPDPDFLGTCMRHGDAGQGVVVGDGHRLDAESLGGDEELLDVAGATKKRIVRGDVQLRIAGHNVGLWLMRMGMLA